MKFLNNVDINKNQAISLGLEISSSHPASPVAGQVYFNSSDSLVYVYNGTSWNPVAGGLKTARIVIGTSTAGWTSSDCDYLCDGTADDVEINAAITALPATGGEIVILDGTYNITAKIDVTKDNVSIRGNGNATILKRMFDSSVREGVITLTGRGGCKIADLQVDGNKISYTYSNNYGIYLYSSSRNTVTSNTCNNNNHGIYLRSSIDNAVTGNTCNNNNNHGILLDASSGNNTITGNTCNNNNDAGIDLASSNNNAVTGNTCNNNDESGIYLFDSSNNTVTGNTCYNNNNSGIYLYSSSRNTVTGNTCNNNETGIYLRSSSDNTTITGNTCNNNIFGISLWEASNNTVAGNTCDSNSMGIGLDVSNNNAVTGNTCNNNNNGIYLLSLNNTVTGNTCNNNASGIILWEASNNAVTGNTCIRGTGLATNYNANQHTIRLEETGNNYNLIAMNNCMGKAVTNEGGTGNTLVNNKFNAT